LYCNHTDGFYTLNEQSWSAFGISTAPIGIEFRKSTVKRTIVESAIAYGNPKIEKENSVGDFILLGCG